MKTKRVGYAMKLIEIYVTANPGCTKYAAGRWAWQFSHGNTRATMARLYGPVNRAIAAGLIRAEKVGGRYELTESDKK